MLKILILIILINYAITKNIREISYNLVMFFKKYGNLKKLLINITEQDNMVNILYFHIIECFPLKLSTHDKIGYLLLASCKMVIFPKYTIKLVLFIKCYFWSRLEILGNGGKVRLSTFMYEIRHSSRVLSKCGSCF